MATSRTSRRSFLAASTAAAAISTPALAKTGTVPVLPDPDADLRAALAVLQSAEDLANAADLAADDACERLDAMGGPKPPLPEAVYERDGDEALSLHARMEGKDGRRFFAAWFIDGIRQVPRQRIIMDWSPIRTGDEKEPFAHVREVDGVRQFGFSRAEPWPEAQERADEIVAAWVAYEAEIERRLTVSGYRDTHEAAERALEAAKAAQDRVVNTLARTKAGGDLKLDLLLSWHEADETLDWSVAAGGGAHGSRLAFSIIRDLRNLRREA